MHRINAWMLIFAFALSALGCSGSERQAGAMAPDFRAEDLTGRTIYLNAELGKPVVLSFFATWCSPCRDEMPMLISIHNRYKGKARVLTVVVDPENRDKVASMAKAMGVPYPMLMDHEKKIMKAYRISEMPTTVLIGKDGRIRSRFKGFGVDEKKSLINMLNELTGVK